MEGHLKYLESERVKTGYFFYSIKTLISGLLYNLKEKSGLCLNEFLWCREVKLQVIKGC